MTIPLALASAMARAAFCGPYNQLDLLSSYNMAKWLRRCDIDIDWHMLHHMFACGLLRPIIVLEPAISTTVSTDGRFSAIDLESAIPTFVDLGAEPTIETVAFPLWKAPFDEPDYKLADTLLWHPFQLLEFDRISRVLEIPLSSQLVLSSPNGSADRVRQQCEHIPQRLVEFHQGKDWQVFTRIVALLIACEPLVHLHVHHHIRLRPHCGESIVSYRHWRDAEQGAGLLSEMGLTIDEAVDWHRRISLFARNADPALEFRILFRHAKRKLRDDLEGKALIAHNLYDAAEVLRRYLEMYHGQTLPEEDDTGYGMHNAEEKRRFYGASRTADYSPGVLRRIAFRFGLDPGIRVTWFVEGATELAFIEVIAPPTGVDLLVGGITVENYKGLGAVASGKLGARLESLRASETFAFVAIDNDEGGDHVRQLRRWAQDGLLPIGFRIWRPNFVEANFSIAELAEIATEYSHSQGSTDALTEEAIATLMRRERRTAEDTIGRLFGRSHLQFAKGAEWGERLAAYALSHPRERPVSECLELMRRARTSFYHFTGDFTIDEDGNIVPFAPIGVDFSSSSPSEDGPP